MESEFWGPLPFSLTVAVTVWAQLHGFCEIIIHPYYVSHTFYSVFLHVNLELLIEGLKYRKEPINFQEDCEYDLCRYSHDR